MPNYDREHTVTLTSGDVGKTTFTVPCDLAAEVERLTIENKRLQWLMLPSVSGRAVPLGTNDELRVKIERLQAALEKHHWPDLVPGDGPCETCGLNAEAWYDLVKSVSQT